MTSAAFGKSSRVSNSLSEVTASAPSQVRHRGYPKSAPLEEFLIMRKIFNTFIFSALSLSFCNGLIPCAYGHSLVFGPEFFSSNSGKSQRLVKNFSIQDVSQKFIVSVQGGSGSEKGVRSAIHINWKLIFPPDELGKQSKMLTKTVKLKKQNKISVEVAGEADAPIIVTIMSLGEQGVTAKIPPIGEAVDLEGYARAIFPAGTFNATQDVKISVTASPPIQDIFVANATGPRLPYEIRINTGDKAPGKDVEVSVNYPDSFFASDYQIHIFARLHDNPDSPDVHDRFFLISSGLDDIVKTAKATLPKDAFSNRYGKNGTYEAIITIGLTPWTGNGSLMSCDLCFPDVGQAPPGECRFLLRHAPRSLDRAGDHSAVRRTA